MKALLVGVALLALTAPAAYAQSGSQEVPPPEMEGPGQYRVFFAFDRADLSQADRQVIAQAVEDYRRTGTARITATGHTDASGSAAYNLELSRRRAEAVAGELVRLGVPAAEIATVGRGEEDLLVPTADGVREPRNRRVEIVIPQPPPAAAPAPAAEAPAPAPMPEPARVEPDRFTFALGPVYGHNFGETDGEDDKTENDLVGAELTFRALPGFLGGVSLKQMGLWSFNGIDDGLTGRSVASLDFAPDFGIFRPTLAVNGGGVYGQGVQDGFVAGRRQALLITGCQRMPLGGKKDRAQGPAKLIREAKRLGKAPGVAPGTDEARVAADFANSRAAQNDHHAALHNLLLANPFGQQLPPASRSQSHHERVALSVADGVPSLSPLRAAVSACRRFAPVIVVLPLALRPPKTPAVLAGPGSPDA